MTALAMTEQPRHERAINPFMNSNLTGTIEDKPRTPIPHGFAEQKAAIMDAIERPSGGFFTLWNGAIYAVKKPQSDIIQPGNEQERGRYSGSSDPRIREDILEMIKRTPELMNGFIVSVIIPIERKEQTELNENIARTTMREMSENNLEGSAVARPLNTRDDFAPRVNDENWKNIRDGFKTAECGQKLKTAVSETKNKEELIQILSGVREDVYFPNKRNSAIEAVYNNVREYRATADFQISTTSIMSGGARYSAFEFTSATNANIAEGTRVDIVKQDGSKTRGVTGFVDGHMTIFIPEENGKTTPLDVDKFCEQNGIDALYIEIGNIKVAEIHNIHRGIEMKHENGVQMEYIDRNIEFIKIAFRKTGLKGEDIFLNNYLNAVNVDLPEKDKMTLRDISNSNKKLLKSLYKAAMGGTDEILEFAKNCKPKTISDVLKREENVKKLNEIAELIKSLPENKQTEFVEKALKNFGLNDNTHFGSRPGETKRCRPTDKVIRLIYNMKEELNSEALDDTTLMNLRRTLHLGLHEKNDREEFIKELVARGVPKDVMEHMRQRKLD